MTEVKIRNVSKCYSGGAPVLRGVDLAIKPGELFFLLGPSGCGKSTLLRILAGLIEPDGGEIFFDADDILKMPPEKRRSAMVFQNYALWPHLTVYDNVAFAPRNAGVPKAEVDRIVKSALEIVELGDFPKRKPPSLSGGQQQRVALARALAAEPRLLLMDEPLSNLDARLRDAMRGKIKHICKERNLTTLYVTHDRQEALSMADRLAVMHKGVIRRLGTPEEVYDHPGDCFTARFLGDVNFIPGELRADGIFSCALGEFKPASCTASAGKATGAIRPERIRFATPGEEGIAGTVTGRTFLGESCEWEVSASGQTLVIKEGASPVRPLGSGCKLIFDPDFFMVMPVESSDE